MGGEGQFGGFGGDKEGAVGILVAIAIMGNENAEEKEKRSLRAI